MKTVNKHSILRISYEKIKLKSFHNGYGDFLAAVEPFFKANGQSGAKTDGVRHLLKTLLARHFVFFSKYGLQSEQLINHMITLIS